MSRTPTEPEPKTGWLAQTWLPKPTIPPCRAFGPLLTGTVYVTGPTPGWFRVNLPLAIRLAYRPTVSPKYTPVVGATGGLSN